ncbi:MAG: hypothetical protein IKZ88_06160 [Neisseriaceae bacterium]|nr:hypothetical protein [Neisseriaceae bacterium]
MGILAHHNATGVNCLYLNIISFRPVGRFGGLESPPYNDTCGVGGGLANPPYGVSVINRCVWWARMPTLRRFCIFQAA